MLTALTNALRDRALAAVVAASVLVGPAVAGQIIDAVGLLARAGAYVRGVAS